MEEKIQNVPILSNPVLLHLCRHFSRIPKDEILQLIGMGIKESEIEEELQLHGSKFFSPPFSGVFAVVDYLQKNWASKKVLSKTNDILVSQWNFSPVEYPHGIGSDGLLSLQTLSVEEASNVYKKDRKSFWVNAFPTTRIVPTWDLIVISKFEPVHEVLTVYPGTYAPPFPMEGMEPEFFKVCDDFWNVHALVEFIHTPL
jgi:hypothetical protein